MLSTHSLAPLLFSETMNFCDLGCLHMPLLLLLSDLCQPMDCSVPGFSDLHYLPEFAQTHDHWVGDAI